MIKRKQEGQSGVATVELFFHYQSTPRKCVKDYFFLPAPGLFAKRFLVWKACSEKERCVWKAGTGLRASLLL